MDQAGPVAAYYDDYTKDYLVGSDILQVGRFANTDDEHVLLLAERAHMQDGMTVLDAGCGVGGVMTRLAQRFVHSTFHGVTISPEQVRLARERTAGLANCELRLENFEQLSVPAETYDLVYFCESLGHADLGRTIAETFRVLKPRGLLYVKDVCLQDRALDSDEQAELEHFCSSWLYECRLARSLIASFEAASFQLVRSEAPISASLVPKVVDALRKTRLPQRHRLLKQLPPLEYADFLFRKR